MNSLIHPVSLFEEYFELDGLLQNKDIQFDVFEEDIDPSDEALASALRPLHFGYMYLIDPCFLQLDRTNFVPGTLTYRKLLEESMYEFTFEVYFLPDNEYQELANQGVTQKEPTWAREFDPYSKTINMLFTVLRQNRMEK